MSDDWSLNKHSLYYPEEIETLREKLIEDILGYIDVEIRYDKSLCSHMKYVIKDIINKRFGMVGTKEAEK